MAGWAHAAFMHGITHRWIARWLLRIGPGNRGFAFFVAAMIYTGNAADRPWIMATTSSYIAFDITPLPVITTRSHKGAVLDRMLSTTLPIKPVVATIVQRPTMRPSHVKA